MPVFPVYNLFVGLAVISGYLVVERFLHPQDQKRWPYHTLLALGVGAAGAIVFSRWIGLRPADGYAFSFLGGLVPALAALAGIWKFLRRDVLACLDACAIGISVAHGIGRLGCFFGGCCYGRDIVIPSIGSYRFPTQLAESLLEFLIFIRLLRLRRSGKFPAGRLAIEWLLWYGIFRLLLEFLRGYLRGSLPWVGSWLSPAQVLSLGLILLATWLALGHRGKAQAKP